MRRYRNTKTGAIIEVYGQISGKNWEPFDEAPVIPAESLVSPYAEIFGEDAGDLPLAKPKTTRRRKSDGNICNH